MSPPYVAVLVLLEVVKITFDTKKCQSCMRQGTFALLGASSATSHVDFLPHKELIWLVVFNVPSTARSFRDGNPIYCPLRRT